MGEPKLNCIPDLFQYLKKLNRQERVVEEVKLVLKPHYAKKHIAKEDYKEILRRAVPKVCFPSSLSWRLEIFIFTILRAHFTNTSRLYFSASL